MDRVGDEQVVDAAVREHLRLADRGDREADGPGRDLAPSNLQALVGFGVGSERDAALAHQRGHTLDVGAESIEVDDDERGVEIGSCLGVEPGVGHGISAGSWIRADGGPVRGKIPGEERRRSLGGAERPRASGRKESARP
jgi:hypothetical protein